MSAFDKLAEKMIVEKTMAALKANGIETYLVENGVEAKKKFFEILPVGAEVMNNSSTTLLTIGVADEIIKSGKYNAVRERFAKMDPKTQGREMKKMAAAAEWGVGSVHAVTEKGEIMIASASGSQIPQYAYGSDHVLWVVGTQKIVQDLNEGFKRLYEYTLPLEDARARKAYGMGSSVNKLLIINKEPQPGRTHLIFVNEVLGF